MNKFAIGALVLSSAGSLAFAGGEGTTEWSTLDREILSLTANQGATAGSFGINGYVRARGVRSKDVDVSRPERNPNPAFDPLLPIGPLNQPNLASDGQQDLSGFVLDNARVELRASQGDYGAYISLEGAGGTVGVLDAYATFKIAEGVTGQMGRFRAPFLWSSFMVEENNMLLLDRTFNGQIFQGRQDGAQLSGVYDQFGWWAALQNGIDGLQDKISWTVRAQVNALGTGMGKQEGAFGSSSDTNITIGAAYTEDTAADLVGGVNSGGAYAVDAGLTQGAFSAHFELVNYEADIRPIADISPTTGVVTPVASGSLPAFGAGGLALNVENPWTATASYAIQPDVVDLVVRFEDLDDNSDTSVWSVGLNYYLSGHNAKWTLQGSRSDSDLSFMDVDTLALGLTVGV